MYKPTLQDTDDKLDNLNNDLKKAVDDTTDDLDKFKSQANDKFQNLGNMGRQISMAGLQNYIDCWLKIKEMYVLKRKKYIKKGPKK